MLCNLFQCYYISIVPILTALSEALEDCAQVHEFDQFCVCLQTWIEILNIELLRINKWVLNLLVDTGRWGELLKQYFSIHCKYQQSNTSIRKGNLMIYNGWFTYMYCIKLLTWILSLCDYQFSVHVITWERFRMTLPLTRPPPIWTIFKFPACIIVGNLQQLPWFSRWKWTFPHSLQLTTDLTHISQTKSRYAAVLRGLKQ